MPAMALLQWVKPLINIMLDGTAGIADYQCYQILGQHYHRLAPVFPSGVTVPMDDIDKVPYMIEFAESFPIEKTIEWLKQTWVPN